MQAKKDKKERVRGTVSTTKHRFSTVSPTLAYHKVCLFFFFFLSYLALVADDRTSQRTNNNNGRNKFLLKKFTKFLTRLHKPYPIFGGFFFRVTGRRLKLPKPTNKSY